MKIDCCLTLLQMQCTNCDHKEKIIINNNERPDGKVLCPKCGFKSLDIFKFKTIEPVNFIN